MSSTPELVVGRPLQRPSRQLPRLSVVSESDVARARVTRTLPVWKPIDMSATLIAQAPERRSSTSVAPSTKGGAPTTNSKSASWRSKLRGSLMMRPKLLLIASASALLALIAGIAVVHIGSDAQAAHAEAGK